MYKILRKKILTNDTTLYEIEALRIAKACYPGQFVIVIADLKGERIPLTICDYDKEAGTITLVIKSIGYSTQKLCRLGIGDYIKDVVGPLGKPADWIHTANNELKKKSFLFIGGGVGIAPVFPQVKWLHNNGIDVDVIIGARCSNMLILEDELRAFSANLYVVTDDDSGNKKGVVTDIFKDLIEKEKKHYDRVIAIGPMIMMKYVVDIAKEFEIPTTVSLNSLMLDGTGMCGACRVTVGGKTQFTCVDGPEFEGKEVDFAEALRRQAMSLTPKGRLLLSEEEKDHSCFVGGLTSEFVNRKKRIIVRNQPAGERIRNFTEVCYGYNAEEAILEAKRCLQCKKAKCIEGCPVNINIPAFIAEVAAADFEAAYSVISRDSALPAVCGRVCPQETQCECKCVVGLKGDPVAIGKLERFVGDFAIKNKIITTVSSKKNGHRVAVVGSGPAGITCSKELLTKGYDVTVFEALHEFGGVLTYGIPSFRLPKDTVVNQEIENVRNLGAKFENNIIIGRTISVDSLFEDEGFEAIFIASGAGLPSFMNIKGENLNGVVSANEFLTRNNLLFSYKSEYDTPSYAGKNTIVVGGGNVAMDAARTAIRLGANVSIVYRRSETELPARIEEVEHAKEEGVKFYMLTNPLEFKGNVEGWVESAICQKMELGEPDSSGRRKPVPVQNSEFELKTDYVIMSIGTSPNPLIANTTKGLAVNKWGCIVVDNDSGQTSREGIFAGGDAVSGAATVILAMEAGKKAAIAIDKYLSTPACPA